MLMDCKTLEDMKAWNHSIAGPGEEQGVEETAKPQKRDKNAAHRAYKGQEHPAIIGDLCSVRAYHRRTDKPVSATLAQGQMN